jgi:DNA polymerase III delta prime subunit
VTAIDFALHARDVCLIHGPPGTGKTTTVIELIRQIVAAPGTPQRVLACAPSNVAVDNLVEKLGKAGVRVCRWVPTHYLDCSPLIVNLWDDDMWYSVSAIRRV